MTVRLTKRIHVISTVYCCKFFPYILIADPDLLILTEQLVEELTVTDSVPDFCGSPLGAMEISFFWPKNRDRSTFGAAPWQYHRGDPDELH